MPQIVFNIDSGNLERVKDALAGLFPIPMIPNPDPLKSGQQIPKYTKAEWAKECVRQWIIKQVARYEQKIAQEAIKFNMDDTLVV